MTVPVVTDDLMAELDSTGPILGDRCDRCIGQAKVRVVLPTGNDLMFCNHHFNKVEAKLVSLKVRILRADPSIK